MFHWTENGGRPCTHKTNDLKREINAKKWKGETILKKQLVGRKMVAGHQHALSFSLLLSLSLSLCIVTWASDP